LARMYIGSSASSGRITNRGYFKFSGFLYSTNANESLGRFILATPPSGTNAYIDLGNVSSKFAFADSSGESWADGVLLQIKNWSGSTNGGGTDQLRFGTNRAGLTPAQLGKIRFVNPDGFAAGTYYTAILNTGEIIPTVH